MEMVAEEEIMAEIVEIVEEVEQAEEAEILWEETAEDIARPCQRRSGHCGGGGIDRGGDCGKGGRDESKKQVN